MSVSLVERWNGLTREQKLSVWILSFCGIFALALSVYRVRQSVINPFFVDKAKALAFRKSLPISEAEEEARLHRIDTDGDGLSDWDELNLHKTNPNLKDTCGDGLTDNARVLTGRNLVCVSGGANASGEIDVTGVAVSSSQLYGELPAEQDPISVYAQMAADAAKARASSSATSSERAAALNQGIPRNAAVIRAALRGKVDSETLLKISDEQLLAAYDKALEDQKRLSATSTAP